VRNPKNRMSNAPLHRCPRCRLLRAECLCALIPTVPTRTRVVLVLHEAEDRKPSNTGRLALSCLPNSALVMRGGREQASNLAAADWTEHGTPVLLFPHPEAQPIESWCQSDRPVTLVVPDGTWRQAQRVRRRVPGLDAVPCAFVKREEPSQYRLRHTPFPRRLATMEAIAEALGVLEGPQVRQALLDIFQVMVERSLRVRAPAPRTRPRPRPPAIGDPL
jgi:DTW domain-containing protein YfiP